MNVPTDRDLQDQRRETEAAVLAAVKSAAVHATECDCAEDGTCTGYRPADLLVIVEAWSLVSGTRKTASPAALRG